MLEQNPLLALSEYWYTPAIHFAVREGHIEAAQLLLDAGAHPEWNGLHDSSVIQMASERGYTEIARLLEETMDRRGIRAQPADHPIHAAATRGSGSTNSVRLKKRAETVPHIASTYLNGYPKKS